MILSPDSGVQILSVELAREVTVNARRSPRKRANFNFHSNASDAVHRFLNVLLEGTYVQPHRHSHPPKHESFVALRGSAVVFLFDDSGEVTAIHRIDAGGPVLGVDLPAGVWHTVAALTSEVICFEVKPGPWDVATDKEFATWAPPESEPARAAEYLGSLLARLSD